MTNVSVISANTEIAEIITPVIARLQIDSIRFDTAGINGTQSQSDQTGIGHTKGALNTWRRIGTGVNHTVQAFFGITSILSFQRCRITGV